MPFIRPLPEVLESKASWFVALLWFMILPAAFYALAVGMVSSKWATHNPLHQDVPLATTRIFLAWAVPAFGLVVALAASIAHAAGRGFAAALIGISSWLVVVIGGPICVALTPRGPQSYDRVVAGQHFLIPWRYRPVVDFVIPNGFGFTAHVCLQIPQLGVYDADCGSAAAKVTVAPGRGSENQNGLNTCGTYICQRRLVVQGFVIDYDTTTPDDDPDKNAPNSASDVSSWSDTDRNLAALVMSWKVDMSAAMTEQK